MMLKNLLGPDKKIAQREIVLKGRPKIVDRLQEQSLDAAETIVAWLKPKPPADSAGKLSKSASTPAQDGQGNLGVQGGSYQIQRLLAIRDVHLLAPSKNLSARDRLEADFKEQPRPRLVASSTAPASVQPASDNPRAPAAEDGAQPGTTEDAAQQTPKPSEPAMLARANRVEASIVIDADSPSGGARNSSTSRTNHRAGSASPGEPGSNYEVRDLRLFGAVSLHQDPSPGKTKGQDAIGETLILHNEGPGKAVFNLYHRDPRAAKSLPTATSASSITPARVSNEDMTIEGEVIGMNQITDQAWAYGPGKLIQFTDRGLLSDKAENEDARTSGELDQDGGQGQRLRAKSSSGIKESQTVKSKPRTRAGKPLAEKVPLEITWGEKMLFYGRSVDPDGRPAARAEFYKNARAEMEDGLLYCTKLMTTYTDRPVPLAELGKMSPARPGATAKSGTGSCAGREVQGARRAQAGPGTD